MATVNPRKWPTSLVRTILSLIGSILIAVGIINSPEQAEAAQNAVMAVVQNAEILVGAVMNAWVVIKEIIDPVKKNPDPS